MLQATPTGRKGVTKAWWFRYKIDKRERVIGSALRLSRLDREVLALQRGTAAWPSLGREMDKLQAAWRERRARRRVDSSRATD